MSDGTVYSSGTNTYGEIGDNDRDGWTSPYQISNFSGVGGVAGGLSHSSAFKSTDTTARAWGDDFFGQLGDNNPVPDATPSQASGLTGATSIAAGLRHTVAREDDGTVWGWRSSAA